MTCRETRFRSELELVEFAMQHLSERGFTSVAEVPNLGCSVDIAAKKKDRLFLFEAKLHDWRRALKQAEPHLFVADYVFIVMPRRNFSAELWTEARSKRIGIIFVEANSLTWNIQLKARSSNRIWLPQRQKFERHMELVLNAG